ncbi:MAG TPA: argininosuccinate lyase [Polyangiaceae bacterium]|nr:argininosuccinate lyase [Polyangiaceae bacterium]
MTTARGGRLPGNVDAAMERLNTSVDVDSELYREDIRGSIAHAHGLARAGIISHDEAETIVEGLETIRLQIESGEHVWRRELEDVHMNIETRLGELIGPLAGKLHTARSRNDQVATDLRLYCRRRGAELQESLANLASVVVDRAESELDVLMPAYTHLQRAQPSRLSHHLMAWEEILYRDWGRMADALGRANESPLGAGAVAGTGFTLDREGVARELGFERPMRNSIDATGSRDFLMEIASALAILGVHLSRIGEEIVLWSTQEFGFMTLADGFATSSSMMPQKKNPDVAELVRGRAARLVGAVTSLFVLEKGLPFGYDRDLQEDKRPIFDAFSCAHVSLDALSGALATATFHAATMRAALDRGHLCATDLADHLVQRGMPFREAHHVIGGLVREAEKRGVELSALPNDVLETAHPALGGAEARAALDPVQAVERRVAGGPARDSVLRAVADARSRWHASVPART